jgi:RNA polymerase sigma-70 factor (ECF subfamily)
MVEPGTGDPLTQAFENRRARLVTVAQRMLGSRADAEDAVQEAWLRLARQDTGAIDNLDGWLTTVVGRVCIDVLRSRKSRQGVTYEDSLTDLVLLEDDAAGPEDDALLADSVGLALLVVLDALRPDERLAFVLHDMFAVPFDEIGQIIGKSTDATKMLASRARHKVRTQRAPEELRRERAVVDAFLAAARDGDFDELLRLLDPNVVLRSHTARGEAVRLGATEVAVRVQHGARIPITMRPALVNGDPGVVASRTDGRILGLMICIVENDRIVEIVSVSDPQRLANMGLSPAAG